MPKDRRSALADWQALTPGQRQLAWRAAAGTAVIEDRELARVVARYAATMRGQIPTRHLVAGLLVLVVWLILAVFLIAGGQARGGTILAAIGVLGAGVGIGALQFRQAGFDRLYLASVAVLAGTAPNPEELVVDDDLPVGGVGTILVADDRTATEPAPEAVSEPPGAAPTAAEPPAAAPTAAGTGTVEDAPLDVDAPLDTAAPLGGRGPAGDEAPDGEQGPRAGAQQPEPASAPVAEPPRQRRLRQRAPQPPVAKPRNPRDVLKDPEPTFYPEPERPES
jgi:hypothetical protein